MKTSNITRMLFSLPLAVLAALLLVVINEVAYRQSTEVIAGMQQAQVTRSALNNLMQNLLDAETGQRGYLLTGDAAYLEPYNSGLEQVNQNLDFLRQILTPDKTALSELGVMSRHISRKLAELDLTIRMRRENKEDAWRFVMTTDVGKDQMQAIREKMGTLGVSSIHSMEQGQVQIKQTLLLSRIGISIMSLAGLLAFYMYLQQTKQLLAAGRREQASLQRERDQLDLQVRERTVRLAELATHLQNVREDERGHLARELHDELGALLTAAKLDVARLKSRLGLVSPEALERLSHLTETLNSGIALKRRIVEDLRPSSLSHLGLVASLEILAREFADRSGLQVNTDMEDVALGGSSQLTVYRVVQESLTNIAKYAQAQEVLVSLHKMDGYVTIEVRDDGLGFELSGISPSSHGLSGMRHRVEAAGGRLTITTAPESGTTVSAVLPKASSTD